MVIRSINFVVVKLVLVPSLIPPFMNCEHRHII